MTHHVLGNNDSYRTFDAPFGRLTLVGSDNGLTGILWDDERAHAVRSRLRAADRGCRVLLGAERQLGEYFAGRRRRFDLTLDFAGTAFQRCVWRALLTIPFGETRSYGQMASHIGRPDAARAVGAAIGRNPLPIVAPCHRVIGSGGRLTGFAGGLAVKASLLALEGVG
jgi:methylated-DNA-[protein]-cysteine S-methyltransferase